MELRNCPSCGKLFVYTIRDLCPKCAMDDEKNFNKVRDYLHDNPNSTVEEVSEETGVDSKRILEYLKEGRLMLKHSNADLLSCESCGKPILTGRFCESCISNLKAKISSGTKRVTSEGNTGKLHISKLRKKR